MTSWYPAHIKTHIRYILSVLFKYMHSYMSRKCSFLFISTYTFLKVNILNHFWNHKEIIFNWNYKLIWIMISSMFSLFYLHVFDTSYLELLEFWIWSESNILEWFKTWYVKHARNTIHLYYQRRKYRTYIF